MPRSDDVRDSCAAPRRAGEDQRVAEESSGQQGAPLRVLMVEDSEDDAILLTRALTSAGYDPAAERVETGDALRVALDRETWDVVLIDYVMPRLSPVTALEIVREKGLDIPCILVSGKVTDEIAIEAMRAGAVDFVAKDALARLPQAIERERNAAAGRTAARENEARLAAIVETAVDGIITIDERAVVESMNPAAASLLGYVPEEVIGHNVNMLMPEPYHSEHQGYIEHYLRTGEARIIGIGRDVEARRKDGTTVPIHLSVSEARLGGRRIFTGILHDESERKRAGEALRTAQAQLQMVTETMAVGVTRCSRDRRYLWANRAYAEWLGRPPQEIAGHPIPEVIGAAGYAAILPYIERVLTGQRVEYEAAVDYLGAGHRWINAVYTPTLDAAGVPDGWVAVVTDITERKRTEQRVGFLAEASRILASSLEYEETLARVVRLALPEMADACAVGLVEDGGTLRLVAWALANLEKEHAVAEGLLRYQPSPQSRIAEVLRTGRPVLVPEVDDTLLQSAAQDAEHLRLLRELGVRSSLMVPLVASGRTLGVVTLAMTGDSGRRFDEDDVPLAEELGRRAGLAIENARLYEAEQKARAEAEEANKAKDQFVAMISHELRNPLAAITAGVGLLRQSCPAEGRSQRALEIVERNTSLQTRLINDLLDLSRLQRGKLQLQRAPVELVKVVAPVCQSFAGEAEAARLALTCDTEADLWVHGDMDRLQQVVLNLLSNAAKFTPAPGEIRVRSAQCEVRSEEGATPLARGGNSALRTAHFALLSVEDTGIGISPELLPNLFEMFQQGEIASQRAAGLGLGLALVKGIVERHGGRVWAESEGVGKGSRFLVELPLVDAPAMSRALAPGEKPGRPVRVLVVEDNADTRSMLAENLTLAGYDVRAASNGDEALAVVREARPDIMLVDIGLPGMDGFEFLRRAREEPGIADVPAFAVTGYGSEADVRRGREVGFSGHFVKPVNLDSLKERIREYVGAPPAAG